jgi:hypothetical protein
MSNINETKITFDSYIQDGTLHEVSKETYSSFIKDHIKKHVVPCENALNVFSMRKRVGALYIELKEISTHNVEFNTGLYESYEPKYPNEQVGYGWLEDNSIKKYYLNRKIYPSWFEDNVAHFCVRS